MVASEVAVVSRHRSYGIPDSPTVRDVIVTGSGGTRVEMIAATTKGASAAFDGIVLLAVVVLLVMCAAVGLAYVRRRMRSAMDRDGRPGFDLVELRRLRDNGQVSAAEYESLTRSLYPEIR